VAYPEVAEEATAIVLIHEIYGHSDWFRLMTDHLAEAGYVVVAPDLLSQMAPDGKGTDGFADISEVRKAVSGLSPDQVTIDLKATVKYAKEIPAGNGKVVGSWFLLGRLSDVSVATNSNDIEAALVFYGTAPEAEYLKPITAPVYGFYAENDARVNATLIDTAKAMTNLGKSYQM
jgi:carboxymethylenebutenolidase